MLEDIKKAKENDKKAIEKLLKENENLIQSIISKYYVKGMEKDDLEQEASIAFLDSIKAFNLDGKTTFTRFASLCIDRRLITLLIASQRQKNIPLNTSFSLDNKISINNEDNVLFLDLLESKDDTTEEKIIKEERMENLINKTEKVLSKFENSVLKLYLKGLTYEEMSNKLETNIKSIDNAIQRIRSKIKKEKLL